MPRSPLMLLTPTLAVLVAGCGAATTSKSAGDFKGDQKQVAQVVDDLSSAASKRDAKKICNTVFAPRLAQQLRRGSDDCQDIVKEQLKDSDVYKVKIKRLNVSGDSASAAVESKFDGDNKITTLRFVREGSVWRLAGLDPAGR